MNNGASVWLLVDRKHVGKMLHALEYHSDIHLIERKISAKRTLEKWLLRSDQFPSQWDGKHVAGNIIHEDESDPPSFNLHLLRAKKKGSILKWHPKQKKP